MKVVEIFKVVWSVVCSLLVSPWILWSLYVLIEKTREEVKSGKLSMLNFGISFLRFYEKNINLLFY